MKPGTSGSTCADVEILQIRPRVDRCDDSTATWLERKAVCPERYCLRNIGCDKAATARAWYHNFVHVVTVHARSQNSRICESIRSALVQFGNGTMEVFQVRRVEQVFGRSVVDLFVYVVQQPGNYASRVLEKGDCCVWEHVGVRVVVFSQC